MSAVFFDLDETLLDRTKSLREFTIWQARGMLRNSISDVEQYCQRFIELDKNGLVWKDAVYTQLIDEFEISDWSASELLQSYELCFSGFCKPKKNAIEAVKALANEGIKLGLISNGKTPFQERNFNALGISDFFSVVIVSEAVGFRKPQMEIFELACTSINVPIKQSIFVGDNPEADIKGARNCGMYTIFIPGSHGVECEYADAICNDFSNLNGIVKCAI